MYGNSIIDNRVSFKIALPDSPQRAHTIIISRKTGSRELYLAEVPGLEKT